FHVTAHIVPVIEDAVATGGDADDIWIFQGLMCLKEAEEGEDAIEHAFVGGGSDGDTGLAVERVAADDEPLIPEAIQIGIPVETGEFVKGGGRAGDERIGGRG